MNRMPRFVASSLTALVAAASLSAQAPTPRPTPAPCVSCPAAGRAVAQNASYPARSTWETRKPSEVGMDDALLAAAIEYAKTRDTNWGKADYMADQIATFGRPMGAVPPSHGRTNGIIIRHGYIVGEFGDTSAVEPTYSVAKSYLSTIFGLALDRKMIKNVTDLVKDYVKDGGYDAPHNTRITWENHLRQASEWEGTLFGKPSTFIGHDEFGRGEMQPRAIREPGSFYEYNDVRVNRFSLSLARVWKRAIPDVLKSEIMDPIGASDSWKWLGYDNSDVEIEGKTVKSVPGGTRWGGGIWMSSRDHARFGLLMARMGKWNDKQIISQAWIKQATTQGGPPNSNDYGYLWWLNTKGGNKGVPTTSYQAQGNGSNTIFIDPEHDLVIVQRWWSGGDFFARVVASIKP